MRRGSSKEEQERKRVYRESGALFADSVNVMDQPSGMFVSCCIIHTHDQSLIILIINHD